MGDGQEVVLDHVWCGVGDDGLCSSCFNRISQLSGIFCSAVDLDLHYILCVSTTCACKCTCEGTHACPLAHAQAHKQTHTHTHSHKHTQSLSSEQCHTSNNIFWKADVKLTHQITTPKAWQQVHHLSMTEKWGSGGKSKTKAEEEGQVMREKRQVVWDKDAHLYVYVLYLYRTGHETGGVRRDAHLYVYVLYLYRTGNEKDRWCEKGCSLVCICFVSL